MGALDGRVAVITGAGRGLGRAHALLMGREGASVVVNDLGAASDGTGSDVSPAQMVVDEIREAGGTAIVNGDDVSDFEGAKRLIDCAVSTFGSLHVLVNNAGILRDRTLVNMSEEDWDLVVRVHMKGHFCTTRHAGAYWRDQFKAGNLLQPALINTTSVVGLFGNFGQANYSSAKGAIAAFTLIAQMELGRYGVRCNAISPYAKTRLTGAEAGVEDNDPLNPAHAAPFVGYLATADCPLDGKVFFVTGGDVRIIRPWQFMDGSEIHRDIVAEGSWTIDALRDASGPLVNAEIPWEMKKATASEVSSS
jgi:NAD(P)-dependent dehydrogenase (short-subunit alcohol dehydrogenase family)